MGRDIVEKIERLVKDIYIYLELDDFQKFREKMDELLSIDLSSLSYEEAETLYEKIKLVQEKIEKKQSEIAIKIKKKTDVQKYGHL